MNKLELIETLKTEAGLNKNEATTIVHPGPVLILRETIQSIHWQES